MVTRVHKNRQTKKLKYTVFAVLGLMSFIAYTMQQNASKFSDFDQVAQTNKPKTKPTPTQEVITPFTQRWQQAQTDIENYVLDDEFKQTRYFFDGYNVASNEEFVLPTEETGAGYPKETYIENLNDVIAADMVPTLYSTGGPGAGGGGIGGIGGGGGGAGGGRGGDNNRAQYVANEDIETNGNDDKSGNNQSNGDTNGVGGSNVGGSNGGISAVPVPPAIWLMGSALIGFVGLRRK